MKNLLKSALFIMLVGIIVFSSCSKEEVNKENLISEFQTEDFEVQVDNNMLVFETVEDYEKALNYLTKNEVDDFKEWDNKLAFTSMRKDCRSKKMSVEKMPISDNILASILNQNAEIQIQGKIFILHPKTEKIIVYDNFTDYTNKTNARKYTFDDEVITKEFGSEEDNIEEINTENECIPCKDAKRRHKWCNVYFPSAKEWNDVGDTERVKYRLSYQKYGLYYTLKSRIWQTGNGAEISVSVSGSWKNRRSSGNIGGSSSGAVSSLTIRPYAKMKRLKDFTFRADFAADDYGTYPPAHEDYTWIKSCVL